MAANAANGVVVAQLVRTTWTKRSHGHPMAARRNSVPERFAIPDVPGQQPACLIHRVEYGEVNGFVSSVGDKLDAYDELHSPLNNAVGMYFDGEALQIVFEGPYPYAAELSGTVDARIGAPGRTVPRRPFALACGEWGQIRYMGRLMKYWTNVTYYEKWVCNIGWFPTLSSRVFIEAHPRRRFDSMPDVW